MKEQAVISPQDIKQGTLSPSCFNRIIRKFERIRNKTALKSKNVNVRLFFFFIETVKESILLTDRVFESLLNTTKYFPEPEKEEQELFRRLKDRLHTVFDVGSRYDLYFHKIKPDCEYHLFEPNKKFTKILKKKISKLKLHKIIVNEFGLADKESYNCVYFKNSQSFEINPYLIEDKDSGERYSTKTLDGYIKVNSIKCVDFLKIDTEGFDYKIILGGMDTIRKNMILYMQFEYWTGVQKFFDLLSPFYDLYLMLEPPHLETIEKIRGKDNTTSLIRNNPKSIIKLDKDVINLIDTRFAPIGIGGNIFAVNKNIPNPKIEELMFNITLQDYKGKHSSALLRKYRNIKKIIKNIFYSRKKRLSHMK